jgi:hypothetical protein
VGDTEALRQIPQTAVEPELGEKGDCAVQNFPFSILWL